MYDYENRLVEYIGDFNPFSLSYRARYTYDYRTRRVEFDNYAGFFPTAPPFAFGATKVVYSGGLTVAEFSGTDPVVQYVRGSDYGGGVGGILYTIRFSEPKYFHYNARGDVATKTLSDGSIGYQAQYSSFGKTLAQMGFNDDRQQSNTKDLDYTSGLINEGFRYRDSETGTFITRDPAGFVDGPNLYAYVVQNPWTKFDPEGLYYNREQFDDDGYLKKKENNKKYNDRAEKFNKEWKKIRETPSGSAMHDYIKNHEGWEFSVQLNDSRQHLGRAHVDFTPGKSKGSTAFFPTDEYGMETVAEEMYHQAQKSAEEDFTQRFNRGGKGDPEGINKYTQMRQWAEGNVIPGLSVHSPKDRGASLSFSAQNNPNFDPVREAQANRAANIIKFQYLQQADPAGLNRALQPAHPRYTEKTGQIYMGFSQAYQRFYFDRPFGVPYANPMVPAVP